MSPLDKQTEQWRQDVQAHITGADSNSDPLGGTSTSSGRAGVRESARASTDAPAGSPCLASQQEALRLQGRADERGAVAGVPVRR